MNILENLLFTDFSLLSTSRRFVVLRPSPHGAADPFGAQDLHLLLEGVGGARFETGVARTPTKDTTYIIRMLGNDNEKVVCSLFLQWDKEPSDISKDRIAAWEAMKGKFGEKLEF
jgi:hypothetical protein